MSNSAKKRFFLLIKITAGLALFYVLANRLYNEFENMDWGEFRTKINTAEALFLFSIAICLMGFNWLLESYKWKIIISKVLTNIDLFTAFRSVLSGVAFGNLAPGRATEFAGKILFLPPEIRATATYLHFVNGIIQLIITLITGVFSLLFILLLHGDFYSSNGIAYAFIISGILLTILGAFIFRPTWFYSVLQKNKTIKKYLSAKIQISRHALAQVGVLSVLRYLIFSIQFYLLIYIFFDNIPVIKICLGISIYYLLTTIIPMFSAIEAFMRGGIAVVIFTPIENNAVHIFMASTFLWFINIVIPSILGYVFFLFLKTKEKNQA